MWVRTSCKMGAIALMALPVGTALTACGGAHPVSVAPGPVTGTVQFAVPLEGRSVQALASQVRSVRVTLIGHSSRTIERRNLRSSVAGRALTFETLHLPVGTYTLMVSAFLDQAETMPCGKVSGSPFRVSSNARTVLTLPAMKLDPTPLGEWKISLSMPADAADRIEAYTYTLVLGDGTILTTTRSSPLNSWGNVPVWPSAVCTTTLKVTARRHGDTYVSTSSVTATIKANGLTTSTLAIWPDGVPWGSAAN